MIQLWLHLEANDAKGKAYQIKASLAPGDTPDKSYSVPTNKLAYRDLGFMMVSKVLGGFRTLPIKAEKEALRVAEYRDRAWRYQTLLTSSFTCLYTRSSIIQKPASVPTTVAMSMATNTPRLLIPALSASLKASS